MSGNMIKSTKLKPINKYELSFIMDDLEAKLGHLKMLSDPNIRDRALGSSSRSINGTMGRKDIMGDIDIAASTFIDDIDIEIATLEEILRKAFPSSEITARRSLKIVTMLYHLNPEHHVQIDFILGDVEILKFMFASPDPSHITNYKKGMYRNFYLSALTQSLRTAIEEDGELVAFAGPKLDRHKGITFEYRHHPKKKTGPGRVKQIKQIDKNEFATLYGKMIELPSKPLTDPTEIIAYLFPKSSLPLDRFDTVETLVSATKENYPVEVAEKIDNRFLEILESIK